MDPATRHPRPARRMRCPTGMISTVLAVVVAAGSFSSLAQPAESAAQLQRQQEERERQLREQLEAPANVRRDGNGPRKAARLPVMPEAPCFHIARIVLAGEDSARFQWALKAANRRGDRALGRCLGSEGINVVLARVQDALVARGYVTTRVLAGPQDLSTGTLVLTVVPGHVRALRFAGPPSRRASLGNAVPVSPGALLNLRDIEQGLENLQRVPSATADTHHRYDGSIAPGESNPVSEVIGSVGALLGGDQRLDIDGNALRNLDDGRQAPNLRDDLGASNLQIPARGGAPLTGHEDAGGIATNAFSAPRFVGAADGSADQVAAGSINGRLPSASLFLHASEGGAWLIQTDPRFSGPRDWLSSEHQLLALGYNPVDLHKRLGDGYYEQGLVREQITQLTGRRFLEGYAGDEEQFRALLENGATFARQFNLRPGLALTDAQMAALTTSHDEAIIGGLRGTTTFISGGDTIGKGAQIIGNQVIGQVGGDLFLRSQQDANEYHRKDVAAGIDAAIGTGGGSVSGYVAASKVDSTYKSVIEQTGVHAGEGGYHINVAGKTTLDGAAIASTADPSNNYFHTGSLEWKDIVNEAKFKATQASVSGGGGSSGGSGSGSFQQKSDSATSISHAGIANGTLIVDDGSGLDIARGVTGLQKDGLKEIFDAREVSEQLQIQQVAGELGFEAAGTLAEENGWAEGSKEKVALHAAVGAAVAALGGGNVLGGAAGAGLNQSLVPVLRNAIEDAGVKESDNPAAFNVLMQAASLAVGSVGGASGASTALAGDVYNRQLHPDEIAFLQSKAEEFAAQIYGCQPGTCSPEQIGAARKRLTVEASQRVDGVMTQRIGTSDKEAEAFINANPVKFAWGEGFTATREQYNDFRYFGDLLSNDKQSLAAIADALGAAGWTKRDFQQAYNPQLLALANQQRGEDGKAVMEMFSGDVGMGLGIIAKIINGDIKGATADAAIAATPWGIGKILRPIIPVADAGKGLIWVGGKKLEAKWVNARGDLTWIDPLTNKIEVFPDKAIFNADHVLPRDALSKIDGFDDFPKSIQNALLEDPRNYQPMVKSANCSKGCKVEGPAGGWVMWNGQPVHPVYKRQLEERQEAFRAVVNERISVYRSTGK